MLGIVLRQMRLGDTSLILTWLSREDGKLKTVAKGIRSLKSPLAGQADVFCISDFTVARSRRTDLHILREARMVETHEGLRSNYAALQTAAYFCELIERVLEPEHPEPGVYDLLAGALRYLAVEGATWRVVQKFERRLAETLGIHHGTGDPLAALATVLPRLPTLRDTISRALR